MLEETLHCISLSNQIDNFAEANKKSASFRPIPAILASKIEFGEPWRTRTSNLMIKSQPQDSLLQLFLKSRRQGLSPRTIRFYTGLLSKFTTRMDADTTAKEIDDFLNHLTCKNGKHGYYRCLRVFFNWLYSPKSGFNLRTEDNPIQAVYAPKVEKKLLPSLNEQQLNDLLEQAENTRDRAIISLFAESGLRLSELTNIRIQDIDWQNRIIKVVCKGNKEGLAVFGLRTETLLKQWLNSNHQGADKLFNLSYWGIANMLRRLHERTGIKCNPHTFRRTFASNLARKGIDILHIKRLGRWESLAMVQHYTASVTFEDSLNIYRQVMGSKPLPLIIP